MGRHIEETRGSGGSAAAASEAVGSNRSLALPQQARRKGHHQGDGVPSLKQQTALRPPAGWISRGTFSETVKTRPCRFRGPLGARAHADLGKQQRVKSTIPRRLRRPAVPPGTPTGSRRRGAVAQRRGSGNGAAARHGTPTRGGSAGAAERTAEGPGNAGRLGEMVKRPAAWQERSGREEGGGKAGKGDEEKEEEE
ncbi:unnamed protein product [Prorocentrum cordatum]|uniref:Uncharacterized protein n=1 Tax=Prorocentrum cordatum TaxID=2364126 RepID=A0ABN9RGF5_9DINO|nr:unnamed protein product [Polarella glacialis]